MYVVKACGRAGGSDAVASQPESGRQTRTFVLDFQNDEDEIFKAFKPYYEATPVGENADPQRLNALHHKLLQPAVFTPPDVTEFAWSGSSRGAIRAGRITN